MEQNKQNTNTEQIALFDYLKIIEIEFNSERTRKQNLDARAGVLLGFLGIIITLFINFRKEFIISNLIGQTITYNLLIIAILEFLFFITLGVTIAYFYKTIQMQEGCRFPIDNITKNDLFKSREEEVVQIILTYQKVIITIANNNIQKALYFQKGLIFLFIFMAIGLITTVFIK